MRLGARLWDAAGRSTRRVLAHGAAGLLHRLGPSGLPSRERGLFRDAHRGTFARNILYRRDTVETLAVLRRRGVPAAPLKGVFLALRLYPDLGCRPQSDVDLWVRRRDLDRAHPALRSAGWRVAADRGFYKDHYHWVYVKGGVLLELHWAFKAPGTCSPDPETVWARCRQTRVDGEKVRLMSPEDELSYLALNKAVHHYADLMDLADLASAADRLKPDWGVIGTRAEADRTCGPLWFGLRHAKDLLGAPVPEAFLARLARAPEARAAAWLARALRPMGGPAAVPARMKEGPWGRLYEAALEGRPSPAWAMLRPLVLPSNERLRALAGGSRAAYWLSNLRRLVMP